MAFGSIVSCCRNRNSTGPTTVGGAFTYDNWANGEPGVTSHVWTLRLPKSYDGTSATLMLEGVSGQQLLTASCDADTAALEAADDAWDAVFYLDGGVPPAVNDAGTEWEWVLRSTAATCRRTPTARPGTFCNKSWRIRGRGLDARIRRVITSGVWNSGCHVEYMSALRWIGQNSARLARSKSRIQQMD